MDLAISSDRTVERNMAVRGNLLFHVFSVIPTYKLQQRIPRNVLSQSKRRVKAFRVGGFF
jgi:hypothetical protein